MTVIAWDGRTLAADKRMSFGTSFAVTTKIFRIGGMLVGVAGDAALAREMADWVCDGMQAETFPTKARTDPISMLVIRLDGSLHYFTSSPVPMVLEDKVFTLGSGCDFAAAALYLGKTAREAVEVAIALDSGCGNGIDTLDLEMASV